MTQEEKQLLLKDLCARLPYGVNLYVEDSKKLPDNEHISIGFIGGYALNKEGCQDFLISEVLESLDNGSVVKLYLRPMSSMTTEERRFLLKFGAVGMDENDKVFDVYPYGLKRTIPVIDFLYEHHLDFRGLIPMGLALEAPKRMYKIE